ncbi:MAG: cellulase family glycosylhydrolase, partial [Bdellovibrionales bacterium]|nr:cellulase family glycosylhydrolase [Bdellovibrionales bacterium]
RLFNQKWILLCLLFFPLFMGCNSSTVDEALDAIDNPDDLLDLADGVDRKPIDTTRFGVNAFSNQAFAGSICGQFAEIRNTLRLNFVRVLFNWDDNVQPTPDASPNFSFYDEIINCIPPGVDALVILTEVPSWMSNSTNWDEGNPRLTFARRWVRRVARRYAGDRRIVGFQVWNEPNNTTFPANAVMQVLDSPTNFVELMSLSSNLIKEADSGRTVISGSTTSIAQNFPTTFDYNKAAVEAGLLSVVDIYGIHYYGTNFERLVGPVDDFLNSISKPIWVTESGRMGVNNQLVYAETAHPFLREQVPGIDRIYWYRFAEDLPADVSFGLKTPDPNFPVSDLYISLRDR